MRYGVTNMCDYFGGMCTANSLVLSGLAARAVTGARGRL